MQIDTLLIHLFCFCTVYILLDNPSYMMRSISVCGARVWKEVLQSNIHRKMNEKLVYSERCGKKQ